MFKKTWDGYSFPEVLISISLLSFVVILFSQLITRIDQQRIKDLLQADVFRTAHSISSLLEDKTTSQMPLNVFLPSNRTNSMTMVEANQYFQITIPAEIIQKKQTVSFSLNPYNTFFYDYKQLIVFTNKEYHGIILCGYATCFIK